MSSGSSPGPSESRRSARDNGWFATFSFLDVGGAISASQWRRLAAAVAKAWRAVLRAVVDRSKARVAGF